MKIKGYLKKIETPLLNEKNSTVLTLVDMENYSFSNLKNLVHGEVEIEILKNSTELLLKEQSSDNMTEVIRKFVIKVLDDTQTKNNPEMVAAIAKLLDVKTD